MHKMLASFTLLATLAFAAAGCVDTATDETYVFGLTADEVLTARRVALTDMSDAAWLDAHRGDFDCARYRGLCGEIGADAAYDVIELGYRLALDGASRDDIRAAQEDAITQARAVRADRADEPETAFFSTTTQFFFGGSNSRRLKVVARATEMWPSLELRASGECVVQLNSFGWWADDAENISGSMTSTFTGLPVETDGPRTVTFENHLTFHTVQHFANHLSNRVVCAAREDGWTATGEATAAM
jgi:hypothetical protein